MDSATRQRTPTSLLLGFIALFTLCACGGGGTAPSGLSYPAPPAAYVVGTAITALNPSVTGTADSYSISPALPAGIALNAASGQISGTPAAVAATATYTITATNANGSTTATLAFAVYPAAPAGLSYPGPQAYTAGTPITPLNPTVTGTVASYSVTPALPAGMALSVTTGQLTGTPTAAVTQATYTVTAANASGSTSFGLVITVGATASGATIIFSRNNGTVNTANYDLYAVRETGGTPIQLTSNADSESSCGVTPSGRVIYQRSTSSNGVDIYSVNSDGTDTRALAVSADDEICAHIVATGPAAGRLVYRRSSAGNGRDLYAVNADGSLRTPLANGVLDEDFAGITNNGIVIYETSTAQNRDIYAVDLEGLANIPLANTARFEAVAGIFGSTIIYGVDNFGQSDLYSVSSVGNGATPVAVDANTNESLAGITPNGTLIIHKQPNLSGNRDVYAGSIGLATSADFEVYVGSNAAGRVVYQRSSTGPNDLYSVLADGTGTVALAVSADEEGLAFITADNRAFINRYAISGPTVTLGDIYRIGLDGTNLTPIATTIHNETFAALIGSTVLYRRETANSVNDIQLWAATITGTGNFRLFTLGGQSEFVAATPSGRVLVNNYTGTPNLYTVNTDGSDQRQLAANATFVGLIP